LFFHNHSLAKSGKIFAKIIKFSDTARPNARLNERIHSFGQVPLGTGGGAGCWVLVTGCWVLGLFSVKATVSGYAMGILSCPDICLQVKHKNYSLPQSFAKHCPAFAYYGGQAGQEDTGRLFTA